jgi:hypothetical protein
MWTNCKHLSKHHETDIVWPKRQSDLTQVDIFAVRENIAKS